MGSNAREGERGREMEIGKLSEGEWKRDEVGDREGKNMVKRKRE